MISLESVEKSFAGTRVLGPVTIAFEDRRTHVLIGPSGCGKSTLLRLVVGLILPDRGQISVDGKSLTDIDLLAHRRRLGYVIQEGALFPHLTARENLGLVAANVGWSDERISERCRALGELTQFPEDGLDRYPRELSGGQRQRVGLMRALMLDPEILLMDEPLGALDPMIRAALQRDLKAIFEQLRPTVLFVTHDLNEAAFFGDTITLLNEGAVAQRGALDELSNHSATSFVGEFLNAQRPYWT